MVQYSLTEQDVYILDGVVVTSPLVTTGLEFDTMTLAVRRSYISQLQFRRPDQRSQRLRKWLSKDAISLLDYELLEIILSPVVARRRTRLICQALLKTFGTFGQIVHASVADLMAIEGMGEAGIVALKAVGAAAVLMLRKTVTEKMQIKIDKDLENYLIARLQNEKVELFIVIFLDKNNGIIADEELGRGTISHSYPREIVKRCLELDGTGIILVHNHPSGISTPSRDDVALTANIIKATSTLGIAVHDHIIVGCGECFSFKNKRLL